MAKPQVGTSLAAAILALAAVDAGAVAARTQGAAPGSAAAQTQSAPPGSAGAQRQGAPAAGPCCGYRTVHCDAPPAQSDLGACGQGIAGDPEAVYFAIIGDFGQGTANKCEGRVATMIDGWNARVPISSILTVGDNNYDEGETRTLKANITKAYGKYVQNKTFLPTLGNHDWNTVAKAPGYPYGRPYPYLKYFSYLSQYSPASPGKPPVEGRYYRAPVGKLVDVFALDANYQEPDGTCCNSKQADWLKRELAASQAPWRLVLFHQPPYSSATEDAPGVWMRWPYKDWCASVVLAGHEHVYERLDVDGFPYYVNGLGGNKYVYTIECPPDPGSKVRYNTAHGAILGVANSKEMELCFYSIATAQPVDKLRLKASDRVCTPSPNTCVPAPDSKQYCALQPPLKPPHLPDCN
jgi:tartrate-resistant acid phosphatase type 5